MSNKFSVEFNPIYGRSVQYFIVGQTVYIKPINRTGIILSEQPWAGSVMIILWELKSPHPICRGLSILWLELLLLFGFINTKNVNKDHTAFWSPECIKVM